MAKKFGFRSLAIACLVLNMSPSTIKADQPVHCLKDQVFGQWDFHVNSEVDTVNLFESNEVCTHKRPNHIQIMTKDHQFKFAQEEKWSLQLKDGFQALATKDGQTVNGTWSTIYDQAMRVELENGVRFIANFRYNVKPSITNDPVGDGGKSFEGMKTGDYDSFDSDCGQTMVGFVQQVHGSGDLKHHKAQCFYAKQMQKDNIESSTEVDGESGVKLAKIVAHVTEGAEDTKEKVIIGDEKKAEEVKKSPAKQSKQIDPKIAAAIKKTVAKQSTAQVEGGKSKSKSTTQKMIENLQQLIDGDAEAADSLPSPSAIADTSMIQLKLEETQQIHQAAKQKVEARQTAKDTQKRKSHKRFNAHHAHVPSDNMDLLIEAINTMDIGWKADTCKLQEHHASYGSHCKKEKETVMLAQTGSASVAQTGVFGTQPNFDQALAEAQKYSQKYASADQIPVDELPSNFDWRNIKGVDFTNPHRDQKACGSCYTVSFTQIVEQRLKLKYGKEQPFLSPQQLMTCNYMNEGCDGGWPFFHGFFAENGALVKEDCAPYLAKTKGDSCDSYSKCEPHSKIQNTYFVGKGYGDSSEEKMMKEIMRNGLVNGELQAPHIFHTYKSGVLTADGIQELHQKVLSLAQTRAEQKSKDDDDTAASDTTTDQASLAQQAPKAKVTNNNNLEHYGIEWQNLNHSVVIVGWGTDPQNARKYWIVRNSYGPNWGDHGDFMIQRGTDDFAIESETTAYDPILCDGGC